MMSCRRRWQAKFAVALRGAARSMLTQDSFIVHLFFAFAVIAMATWLQLEAWRWAVLVIAITMVLAGELVNTALETMVKKLHPEHDPEIGHALDAAAGSVLVASMGAVILGLITMGVPLYQACWELWGNR